MFQVDAGDRFSVLLRTDGEVVSCGTVPRDEVQRRDPFLQGPVVYIVYGWLSKSWSLFGSPKY